MVGTSLPFGPRTAQILMKIARGPRLGNAKHASLLPSSWRTLYEITKLDDEAFDRALAEVVIRPADLSPVAREHRLDDLKPPCHIR